MHGSLLDSGPSRYLAPEGAHHNQRSRHLHSVPLAHWRARICVSSDPFLIVDALLAAVYIGGDQVVTLSYLVVFSVPALIAILQPLSHDTFFYLSHIACYKQAGSRA